jgi:predicted RND superfamily exporter protein
MGVFTNVIVRLRLPILVAVAIVTGLLAYGLRNLRQDEDVLKFLPAEDPDIQLFRRVSAEFGGLDVAIIGVESSRLLSADGLEKIRRMTKAASRVEGVYHTLSFTEVPHLQPTEEEFAIDPLVPEEIPHDREHLEEIRQNIMSDPIVAGRLISADGHAAIILCFMEADTGLEGVARNLREAVTAESGHLRLYFGGLPFIQDHIGGGTRSDIVELTPYVLLVAALATFLFFRRPFGALLVLSAVALGTVWTIGGMAAMDAPMTVVSTSLPMVLVAIGGAYGAHILAAFYVAREPTAIERIESALREVGPPVVASMLTTIAGFASFLAMDVAPMRAFGFQASVGVFLCGLISMVVIPAVLSFSRSAPREAPAERLAEPIWRMSRAINRHRWTSFIGVLIVSAIAGSQAWRVAPDTSLDSFFRPDSGPAQADRFLRERFGGSIFVQIYLRGDLRDPVVLDELRKIVEEAQTIEGVSDVNSFLQTLEILSAGLGGLPRLPRTPEQVAGLRTFMAGNPALRQLVDDEMTRAMIQITVGTQDTRVVNQVVYHLNEFIERELPTRVQAVNIWQDGRQVEPARERRQEQVAARVVRLLRGHGQEPRPDASRRVRDEIRRGFPDWILAPGDDLERAMARSVNQFFNSDDSPFDPFEAASVGVKLTPIARRPVTAERLVDILPAALPTEVASDEEGVEMAAPALADRISQTRAEVLAARLLPRVLIAAGTPDADEQTRAAITSALEELDDARVGLPVTEREAGMPIEVGVTGTPVINLAFGASTQRNQIRSIVVSIVALLLLAMAMFRSVRYGFIAVFPAGITLLVTFGLMGWTRTPLDPGTCMVAALALGIGIDYAIHFLWRRRLRGLSLEETSKIVGPAIAFNAVEVASGFAVMIVADTVPLSRFGILVTVAMVVAAVATFTILPAIEPNKGRA